MALVLGTNCGFVTTAPTGSPGGTRIGLDALAGALRVTSPSGAVKVIEIGWWCDEATPNATFEVGVYTHNSGDDNPEARLGRSSASKGTTTGWKSITGLNIAISESTTYWLAIQLDDTTPNTFHFRRNVGGEKRDSKGPVVTTLPDPWGTSGGTSEALLGIYAIVETAAVGTNMQINIGDAWKSVDAMQINIGDAWKTVAGAQINIGDAWKTIFSGGATPETQQALTNPTIAEGSIDSGDYTNTFTRDDTSLVIADSGGAPANKFKLDLSFDGVDAANEWGDYPTITKATIHSYVITLKAKDSLSTDDYYILIWNFNTTQWDEIGAVMSIGTTNEEFTRSITSGFSDYINDSKEIKIRIANGKALGKGGAPNNNGLLEIDYLSITIDD